MKKAKSNAASVVTGDEASILTQDAINLSPTSIAKKKYFLNGKELNVETKGNINISEPVSSRQS